MFFRKTNTISVQKSGWDPLVPNTGSLFFRASEVAMTVAGTPTYMAPEIQDRAEKGAQWCMFLGS